jgi:hypothetical protein
MSKSHKALSAPKIIVPQWMSWETEGEGKELGKTDFIYTSKWEKKMFVRDWKSWQWVKGKKYSIPAIQWIVSIIHYNGHILIEMKNLSFKLFSSSFPHLQIFLFLYATPIRLCISILFLFEKLFFMSRHESQNIFNLRFMLPLRLAMKYILLLYIFFISSNCTEMERKREILLEWSYACVNNCFGFFFKRHNSCVSSSLSCTDKESFSCISLIL